MKPVKLSRSGKVIKRDNNSEQSINKEKKGP